MMPTTPTCRPDPYARRPITGSREHRPTRWALPTGRGSHRRTPEPLPADRQVPPAPLRNTGRQIVKPDGVVHCVPIRGHRDDRVRRSCRPLPDAYRSGLNHVVNAKRAGHCHPNKVLGHSAGTVELMRLSDEATVGERIAYYRKRRGMPQQVLCGLVGGRSTEWLRQIENGKRDVDKLSAIVAVANALKISPTTLLPGPFRSNRRQGNTLGTAPDVVPEIESAMLRYNGMAGFIGVPDRPPAAPDDLRRRMEHAFVCSQTERWSEMAPFVPGMIADAWHLVQNATTDAERHEAYELQALVYRVTSGMLDRLGESHLPWVAAERSMSAAERTADPLLVGGGAWRMAVVLRHAGRLTESTDAPVAAADALRPMLNSPQAHSVYGSLMLKGAVGAATLGDHRAAWDYFDEASRSADIIGDRNDYWFAFGPTNIAIHRVWLALELGDPARAIDQADYVPHDTLPPELAERRASHLIAVAWAHYLRRHDREALDTLKSARASAPEQLIFTRRVHSMLLGMLRRERRSVRHDLREMVEFVGIAA